MTKTSMDNTSYIRKSSEGLIGVIRQFVDVFYQTGTKGFFKVSNKILQQITIKEREPISF